MKVINNWCNWRHIKHSLPAYIVNYKLASVCYLIFHPLDMYKYDFFGETFFLRQRKVRINPSTDCKKKSIILNKSDTYLWNCKRIKQTVIFFLTYSWLPWVVKHRAYYVYGSKYSANKNSPNNELFQKVKCLLSSQELLYLLGNVSSMPSWSVHSYNINKILLCLLAKTEKKEQICLNLLAPEHLTERLSCLWTKR